jgi:hypothetical protein
MTSETQDPRQQLLDAMPSDEAKTHLILGWRTDPPRYKIELVDLEQSVSATFLGYARKVAEQLTEREVLPYDPEWPLREHEYFELDDDELPGGNLFSDVLDFHNLNAFKRKRLTKPKLYIVAVQTPNGSAFFGKRMAYLKVLAKSAGVYTAVWDGSSFNELTDSVATFSTQFDWVFWDGILYVLNSTSFHAEFRDVAALKDAVAAHVQSIGEHLTIHGADAMTLRCQTSVPMASKLRRVAERGLHLTSNSTQLRDYAEKYKIAVKWDKDDLVFDGSLEGQWAILKLLDEDRTEGPLSHRHYESADKREV